MYDTKVLRRRGALHGRVSREMAFFHLHVSSTQVPGAQA